MKSRKQRLEEARSLAKHYADSDESVVDQFILERRQAATDEAFENDTPDQLRFELSEAEMTEFIQKLDSPPEHNSKLQDLLSRKPVWDISTKAERRKALLASIESNPPQISAATAPANLIREDRDR